MSEEEMDLLIRELQILIGGELQGLSYDEKALQLRLYSKGKIYWLTFSLKPGHPYFFYSLERVFVVKKLKKPLGLFFTTHFMGRTITTIERQTSKGRVLLLSFDDGGQVEFVLIPGKSNIKVKSNGKQVFAYKPKELLELQFDKSDSFQRDEKRDNTFFAALWKKNHSKTKVTKEGSADNEKALVKKQKGLIKMQEKLAQMQNTPWKEVGELLKATGRLDQVPDNWSDFVDSQKSLAENIQNCFQQAKKAEAKVQGTEKRIVQLEDEILNLKSGQTPELKKKLPPNLLAQADLKGRTVDLGEVRLFIGRNGPDNLKLLRKAKAWYLWLHIKDYPGAHGIIAKNKSQLLSQKTIEQAGAEVIKQSVSGNKEAVYEVIYTDCRYVRPIKGAKSGQVTYSHEKVVHVRVKQ